LNFSSFSKVLDFDAIRELPVAKALRFQGMVEGSLIVVKVKKSKTLEYSA